MESSIDDITTLHFHEKSCQTCRYVRHHKTSSLVAECLFHGRSLSVGTGSFINMSLRGKVCSVWKRRPKTWIIYSEGVENNPYFNDPYIKRETCKKLRKKWEARYRNE